MQYNGEFYRQLYDKETDQMQTLTVTSNKE